ncbi:beta/gamma crystallin domain-containing protein [Massilia sp. GCM10020059]|uniref:Calcium-dependent cell adhesion molecule N-terminal domain-containing protein n=1 Tax=Massilia agrisoli TaxID=2892444 RepID=A0ABS8IQ92_9BURK|nr:beta/gamma crystallin domain-containing protein [Massilia agrisoli]MCC6070792.1 hypothetical protein [Massilia agrisoli]
MSVTRTRSKRLALSLTMVLAAATAATSSAQSGQTTTTTSPTTTPGATTQGGTGTAGTTGMAPGATQRTERAGTRPYVFMLVPVDVAAKQSATKGGCWAKIYDGENYMGDTLTLTGPISLADMTGPFGLNWDDKVNSVEVGSKATLTVFDNEAFRDQVAQFKSGQKVPDISKKLGFFDEFASVRLTCSK